MISDMLSNKKLNSTISELLFRVRKLNTSLAFIFITQSHFAVSKKIRLNSTHYLYENSKYSRVLINCV